MTSFTQKLGRLVRWAAITAAVAGVIRMITRSKNPPPTGEASWSPLKDDKAGAPVTSSTASPAEAAAEPPAKTPPEPGDEPAGWVEPVDGVCPASHPIKGNAQSKIFHVPEGASYDRTIPERCYATPEAAEADGFRAAKR